MIHKYVTCTSKKTDTSIFILYFNIIFRMHHAICYMQVDCQFVEMQSLYLAVSFSFHKTDFYLNDSLKYCPSNHQTAFTICFRILSSGYLFIASVVSQLINHMASTDVGIVCDGVYKFIYSHLNIINIYWIIFAIRWSDIRQTIRQNNVLHLMEIIWIIVWHSIWNNVFEWPMDK